MTRASERRIVFGVFLIFTAAAYGACYVTIRRAIDAALVSMAGTWP